MDIPPLMQLLGFLFCFVLNSFSTSNTECCFVWAGRLLHTAPLNSLSDLSTGDKPLLLTELLIVFSCQFQSTEGQGLNCIGVSVGIPASGRRPCDHFSVET